MSATLLDYVEISVDMGQMDKFLETCRACKVFLVAVGLSSLLCTADATAALVRPVRQERQERVPTAIHRDLPQMLEGRVVAVRRLSRVITIRTPAGTTQQVAVAPGAKVQARGAAGLNAMRSGATVRLTTVAGRNGRRVARFVAVR
jgi:hypothetical protein